MKIESGLKGINLQQEDARLADSLSVHKKLKEQEDERVIKELKKRDAEVKAHEQAHVLAAGSLLVSGPNFVYQTGPDGKPYAIGGSVKIDTSPEPGDSEATVKKAEKILRAAVAPGDPSGQDLTIAADARKMRDQAIAESDSTSDSPQNSNSTVIYKKTGKISPLDQGAAIDVQI